MDSFKYCFVCIAAVFLIICVREYDSRSAHFIRLAVAIGTATISLSMFYTVFCYIKNNFLQINISSEHEEIFSVMLKMTGISFVTSTASRICKDSGENGIAGALEVICKLETVLLCIPLIDIIIEKVQGIIV